MKRIWIMASRQNSLPTVEHAQGDDAAVLTGISDASNQSGKRIYHGGQEAFARQMRRLKLAGQRNPSSESHKDLLQVAIGGEARAQRRRQGLTAQDVATRAGISAGMLSKIENGLISPSLGTLKALSSALRLPLTCFFRSFENANTATFVKSGRHGNAPHDAKRVGEHCNLLSRINPSNQCVIETHLVTLSGAHKKQAMCQHDGLIFLYMLEGKMVYRHGSKGYQISPGDSFFFEASVLHGPVNLVEFPIRYLSVVTHRGHERLFQPIPFV
ncbi:helix-turn-helix domain-containing protein [Pseudaminobacter sp. NGMCC 1.201702]|uniref:helix-turn-helix domain-containing protein n=1 Tax=Pseudaminobacter sp. NGMCC 1.201702 TaxID=3391825 RepID=UPI0039F061BF